MLQRRMAAILDCQDGEKEGDNCTHCHRSGDNRLYWGIQLDQDLLETIVSIYPEWFKDCNMNLAVSDTQRLQHSLLQNGLPESLDNASDHQQQAVTIIPLVNHPSDHNHDVVKAELEDTSLQKILDRNKESLKVKLMLRRPINQLIEQGILPPLRSPPAFHEQRQKLERAKSFSSTPLLTRSRDDSSQRSLGSSVSWDMGDLLKSKIQKRPDRQALIQQHILEDSTVDPSLQDKQRQLKKARLADGLNNQLSHRPGPLELVKGNILKADEVLAQAVREGALSFRSTSEASPPTKISLDEDSGSDANSSSPLYNFSEHSQGSFPSLEASESSPVTINHGSPCSAKTSFSMSPPSSVSSPLSIMPSVVSPQSQSDQVSDMIVNGLILHSKDTPVKNRKKAKPKTQPKARTIKFHEYKGPPNAQKNAQTSANSSIETSYDLLLQQQQLFLQWQLEWQQKYPQSVLPPAQKSNGDQPAQASNQASTASNQNIQNFESPISPQKVITKLEDLKVSDLKAELKKRNLPVSGPKPILIERLKSYAESSHNHPTSSSSSVSQSGKSTVTTPVTSSSVPLNVSSILLDNVPAIPSQPSVEMQPLTSMDEHVNNELSADGVTELLNALDSEKLQNGDSRPSSTISMDIEPPSVNGDIVSVPETSVGMLSNEDIVQLQQRCIEKLQRELEKSQMQLQQSIICQPSELVPVSEVSDMCIPTSSSNSKVINSDPPSVPIITTIAVEPSPVPTSFAQTLSAADNKYRQRQIIHQQLQQKIHQQQQQQQQQQHLQLQQKQQQHLQLQQKQQQHHHAPQSQKLKHKKAQPHGNPSGMTSTSNSGNANSTLTALLESQPISSPVNINLRNVEEPMDSSKSAATAHFPAALMTTHTHTNNAFPTEDHHLEPPFPGVVPLRVAAAAPSTSSVHSTSVAGLSKVASVSLPNSIAGHRTSSLPSFSALVNNKPPPVRNNTDPQFLLTRPPPDYDEATRQLNKIKQQYLQSQDLNEPVMGQAKKRKSSVNCQDVDDVLEILIKNGELPPSAAQEPPTPTTPVTAKNKLSSPPLFHESSVTSAITMSTDVMTSPIVSAATSAASSCETEPAAILQMTSSLQSVLDMTPPSSAGFGEQANTTPSSLDFDFHLDVEDIEVIDLESLTREEHQNMCHRLDSSLSEHFPKQARTACNSEPMNNLTNINGSYLLASDLGDFHDRGMDTDIIEWLELLGENNSSAPAPSNSASHFHHPTYNVGNEHDPMLSNMGNSRDSLDLFGVDDMDFKPNETSILSWDKTDFAT